MNRGAPFVACCWDDVAYRRGGPHAPYCSPRCKAAAEAAAGMKRGWPESEGPVGVEDVQVQSCPVPEPRDLWEVFAPKLLHEGSSGVLAGLVDVPPPPDLLDEWNEVYSQRTWDERNYELFRRMLESPEGREHS